jgi:hypothetical protein
MGRALALLAAPTLLVPGMACAQIAPGLRAPVDVPMAMRHSLQYGCALAVYGRPVSGLNSDFSDAGEGLHPPTDGLPEAMKPLSATKTRVAVLDAPGGAAWIFFDTTRRRCSAVPTPTDLPDVEAIAAAVFAPGEDWKPVGGKQGTFELKIRGEPVIRGWYQPATATQPQMIIMEPKQ